MDIDNEIKTIETTCKGKPCLQNCITYMRRACSRPPLTCHGGGSARGVLWLWIATVITLLVAVCLAPLCHAEEDNAGVIVTIHGVGSFYGHSVTIDGMGSGGGDGEPSYVITNVLGVCTNCTQISVDEVRLYGETLKGHSGYGDSSPESNSIMAIMNIATNTISDIIGYIDDYVADISKFYRFSTFGTPSVEQFTTFTNNCKNGEYGSQGTLSLSYNNTLSYGNTGTANAQRRSKVSGYADGIYDYGHSLLNSGYGLSYWRYVLDGEKTHLSTLESTASQIDGVADILLAAEECRGQPDYYVPTSPPDGGGSSGNNTACLEQLQVLTEIVDHIDNDMHKHLDTINTISNNVFKIEKNLDEYGKQVVEALYSNRTTIPDEEGLSIDVPTTWQDVYLAGRPTSWGYNPTNVLERIEILLYGMSGVGTNGDDVASVSSDADSKTHEIISLVESFETDVDVNEDKVESLGEEIVGFFSTFTSFAGRAMTQNEEILPSVQITLNNKRYEVPAITSSGDVSVFNRFAVFLRAVCVSLYFLGALLLVWYYWAWFSKYAIAFIKWASELVNSVLAS